MKRLNRGTLFDSPRASGGDLARQSVRSGATVIGAQVAQFALQLAGIAVLARILTPRDYGLVAMVAVVVNLASMFKDAGLSMATVQRPEINHQQISALFWINVAISAGLGIVLFSLAPLVAAFYGKPELASITGWLSLSFVLGGLSIQHQALLQRHMCFGSLAIIQLASQLGSLILTVVLAFYGWRHWALVGGTLAYALFNTLLTYYVCPWIPGRPLRRTGVRGMLKFGGYMTGFSFVNYFARNTDNLLIGRFIGAEALGVYGRAYQILMLPISMMSGPLSSVAVPALSQLSGDRERLRKYYLHILHLLALVACPISCVAFLASSEIVSLFLGPDWHEVGRIFKLLAIGGLLQPLYNTQSWPHVAVGRADRVFAWGLIGTPVIVASIVMGLRWGIEGVALGYSLAIMATTIGSLAYAGNSIDLSLYRIAVAVARPLIACVAGVVVMTAVSRWLPADLSPVTSLLANASGFAFFYTLFVVVLHNGISPLRNVVHMGRFLGAKRVS